MRHLALVSFILMMGFASHSQKYSFVAYSTEEGLPQSQVTAIGQGNEGYLWVGTLGGLAQFNGKEFITFSSHDGLWNNRVHFISSIDDVLWVGHDGGISLIKNKKIKSFGFTGDDQSRKVSAIVKFNKRILVCTAEGGLFEFKDDKLVKILVTNQDIDRIRSAYVHKNELYLATRGGVLKTIDLSNFNLIPELEATSFYGVTGDDKQLVFARRSGAIICMDLKTKEFKTYDLDTLIVKGCYLDKDEQIWVNAVEGIVRIKKDGETLLLNQTNGLPVNKTSCFFQDNTSNIWVGSKGKGIFRFPGLSFQYFDQSTGFLSDLFLNGFQKNNGDFYFGTFDKGIVKKDKSGRISRFETGEEFVWASVQNVNGLDWFGCEGSLLSLDANDKVTTYKDHDGLPGEKIASFYRIDDQSMYISGNKGVVLYNKGTFTKMGTRDSEYLGTVRDIEIVDGVIYCVSNLGLFVYRNNNFHPVNDVKSLLYSIEADIYGNLWLGAEEGLFLLKNGKVSQVKLLEDDPGSNFINFINHRDKVLYVGTNNGLFVVSNLNGKIQYTRYGIGDGIPDLETNLNSGFFDLKGDFWFGTASGLVSFQKDVERLKPSPPRVNLVSILMNYQKFDYNQYSDDLDEDGFPKKMTFPYSKNSLIFKLDGVSLVHHRELKYQFWLVGLNDYWSPLSDVPTFTFANLADGDYILKMRAVDIDGRISEEIIIPFVINAAFYKTWWSILICIIVSGAIILLIFRLRLRRVNELNEQEKLMFKSKLLSLEQKSVNASMNRHFIFNALNSIQYFINTQDRLSANKYLTNFAQLIRKNLDTATTDHNTISLEEEIARLKLYLSLESMRFQGRFEYEITTEDIDLESIMIPAMIMQPFIENSIIHGILPDEDIKGLISINMKVINNILEITIDDNGIGVNQSISRKSRFDGDHRSQGMEITLNRIDLIRKVSNQRISMEGPVEILNDDLSIKGTHVSIKMEISNLEN
ncbi:MAG: histidine kinase [Crocinitomicaceae bacterium]|tara:strand:- start:3640 stop:6573 length:2934 start_codon:yes stop_codon:yes gene_type:complete